MNTHKHTISENRLIFFEGPDMPPSTAEESDAPEAGPDDAKTYDPEKRKEAKKEREAEESNDTEAEKSELQNIENQLDGIDAKELREAEAFISGAREKLKNAGQKEIYDEGVKTLTPQEKVAIYRDVVATDEAMAKFTSFDATDISDTSLSHFAGNVIMSSLQPIDLGEPPKILQGTVEAIHAEWKSCMGEENITLWRQANDKIREQVGAFLKQPKNAALLKEVTQERNKKERELKTAMAVLKIGDGLSGIGHMGEFLQSDAELQTQARSDVDEMIKKMDGQHGIKIENTSEKNKEEDKMSLKITPKNEAQYKKILTIAKKDFRSNVHETKGFMKDPSIDIKKIDPNEMKVFMAKLRDAKLNKVD